MHYLAAIALLSLAATAQGQSRVTPETNYNPVTITVSSSPFDILATPITPDAPYSQSRFQCNVTGDSRYPPYATGTFPLNVSVPVGQRVRVIFANGNLNGATVTQQGEPGVIVQQGGSPIVQQLGGASPIVQRPSSPVVQSSASPAVIVQQTGPTIVQQNPSYQTPAPVPNPPRVVYVPTPVDPGTPATPAPTPKPTGMAVPVPPNNGPLVCPAGQAGTCDYSTVSNTCSVTITQGSFSCSVNATNVGGGNQCCCCPIPPALAPSPPPMTPAPAPPMTTMPAVPPMTTMPATPTPTATAMPTPTPTMTETMKPTPAPTTPMPTPAATTPTPTMAPTMPATMTPSMTPDKTPSMTPDKTPSMTPDKTPSMTPDKTPSMTPGMTPCVPKNDQGRKLLNDNEQQNCEDDSPSGRRLLQDSGLVPGGPNNGLVEYVALASANMVPGFYAGSTQFGVPYVEFTATEAVRGQIASFRGVLEVAQVVGGVPLYPFRPNPSLSPECQVNVNFRVA